LAELLVKADKDASGSTPMICITPESAGWQYIGFEVYRLRAGDVVELDAVEREVTLIGLEGTCQITVNGQVYEGVGGRPSVFSEASPEAVYAPPTSNILVQAGTTAELAIASAKCTSPGGVSRRIPAVDIPYECRGEGQTRRYIRHILDEHHAATKLLLVEVVTPAGNWSSFPPHKHDEDLPGRESYLEETYYYRINPPHGQALQRVYDKQGVDEVLTPGDGDVVLVPRGYHPVAAIPGFTAYYLNVMAGHQREWKYSLDDDYQHVAPKDGSIMGKVEQR
jgi:5-deoxy-glucuronate isomerase